jgi:hypothetical protein
MRSWQASAALLLVGFGFVMSALVSSRVMERLPHLEDEVAYLFQAKTYAGGHLVIDSPQPSRAYWQPFVVDHRETGHRFSKYTPGWPAVLTLGVWLGQPWVINAFLAALNVALVYRLGRSMFDADVGLIAAALASFSPMALLLNATLMGHTAALTGTTLFIYAYWRMHRTMHWRWGLVAGLALGFVVITRPLTAIGIALPFILWSALWLLAALEELDLDKQILIRRFKPLLALGLATLVVSSAIPIYNYAAVGDPSKNLYTLVWAYDQVGFGKCCGRNVHDLDKGLRHVRFDLSLMAADLFGWQWEDLRDLGPHLANLVQTGKMGTSISPELQEHLRTESGYWPLTGISWLLLPVGLLVGWRKRWTWLLTGVVLCLIAVHIAYWIGSQRYSTRYYFEALSSLALLTALPLAGLMRRFGRRWLIYGFLSVVLVLSLYSYSTPRIEALYRYNFITPETLAEINQRRSGDRPVLVIMTGDDVRWRALGPLMAVTSPYLDSDVVLAWDYGGAEVREAIIDRFPEREIIEMGAEGNNLWFID